MNNFSKKLFFENFLFSRNRLMKSHFLPILRAKIPGMNASFKLKLRTRMLHHAKTFTQRVTTYQDCFMLETFFTYSFVLRENSKKHEFYVNLLQLWESMTRKRHFQLWCYTRARTRSTVIPRMFAIHIGMFYVFGVLAESFYKNRCAPKSRFWAKSFVNRPK